jgi:hypothetical protein
MQAIVKVSLCTMTQLCLAVTPPLLGDCTSSAEPKTHLLVRTLSIPMPHVGAGRAYRRSRAAKAVPDPGHPVSTAWDIADLNPSCCLDAAASKNTHIQCQQCACTLHTFTELCSAQSRYDRRATPVQRPFMHCRMETQAHITLRNRTTTQKTHGPAQQSHPHMAQQEMHAFSTVHNTSHFMQGLWLLD